MQSKFLIVKQWSLNCSQVPNNNSIVNFLTFLIEIVDKSLLKHKAQFHQNFS